GAHPPLATYVRVLGMTTLPWLPLAAIGGWRTWRAGERGLAVRLLVVWTAVAYGVLLLAGKHSPRYLMLLHPALALWAALAVEALAELPPGTPVVAAERDAATLAADGRFVETGRSRDFVAFRIAQLPALTRR